MSYNVGFSGVDLEINGKTYYTNITNDTYDPAQNEPAGASIDAESVPVKGTGILNISTETMVWKYGQPIMKLGPGNLDECLDIISVNTYDADGNPAGWEIQNHDYMQCRIEFNYDLTRIGTSPGDTLLDFGFAFIAADINEYTLMWIVFPYGIRVDNV